MATALTSKQQVQITDDLAQSLAEQGTSVEQQSDWGPDLVVDAGGVAVVVHAEDRSISVGETKIDGDEFKGGGFTYRIVNTILELLQKAEAAAPKAKAKPEAAPPAKPAAPKKNKGKKATKSVAPPAPTSGIKLSLRREPRQRGARRVEQHGKVLSGGS